MECVDSVCGLCFIETSLRTLAIPTNRRWCMRVRMSLRFQKFQGVQHRVEAFVGRTASRMVITWWEKVPALCSLCFVGIVMPIDTRQFTLGLRLSDDRPPEDWIRNKCLLQMLNGFTRGLIYTMALRGSSSRYAIRFATARKHARHTLATDHFIRSTAQLS